jgi:microcystin-dependent protein
MSYTINFTDSVNKGSIIVEDGSINSDDTSLRLPGKDTTSYGPAILENFLHLLENFANNQSPSNPVEGQLWYDTSIGVDQLKIYNGANWISASGIKKGISQPEVAQSSSGDLWVNTITQQVFVFSGAGWVLVGPEFSDGTLSGTKYQTIISSDSIEIPVIISYIQDIPMVIVSRYDFTPKQVIPGFSRLYPGINLNQNVYAKYRGVSETAESLTYGSTTFGADVVLRRDIENVVLKPMRIRHNSGIDIGETQTFTVTVEGASSVLTHRATGSSLDFRINDDGEIRNVVRIKSGTTSPVVGINTLSPTETLDVDGNIKTSGRIFVNGNTGSSSINTGSAVVVGGVGISQNLFVGGIIDVNGTNSRVKNLLPKTTNTFNLGSETLKFKDVYATRFVGMFEGNIVGNIDGSSSVSSRLASTTVFKLTGDVISDDVSFDGQSGGLQKTFTTEISSEFIEGKRLESSNIYPGDEVLINRPGQGLYRVPQSLLTSTVPTMPYGTIMAFAGAIAPSGWEICDGREIFFAGPAPDGVNYEPSIYAEFVAAMGYDPTNTSNWGWRITQTPTTSIYLPDLRGRFLLGHLAGATAQNNDRVTEPAATRIGNYGGKQKTKITSSQLPDHSHSLVSSNGTQFSAISNTVVTDTNVVSYTGIGTGTGSALTQTRGVNGNTGEDFSLVNPYATVNYIIYTGVVR